MPDIMQENKEYFTAVLQSVAELHKTETEIENENELFVKITDFLAKNADKIDKFHAVENEIIEFLQNFTFTGNIDFTPIRDKLLPLQTIRSKLAEMEMEARKLVGKPDRYNCHRATNVCKQLAIFCYDKMKSADYDKVTSALEKNIPALLKIQQEFETENRIFKDIQSIISKNTNLLNKFAAFKAELEQYVATFPHNRDTDKKNVEQRLIALLDVNKETEKIANLISKIYNYADRFNKKNVLQQAKNMLATTYVQMKFNDISNSKSNLQNNISRLEIVIASFDKEQKNTIALCREQQSQPYNIWREDNEQIISDLDKIIKRGTEKENFSLQSFHTRVQMAINKRAQDISKIEQKHRWLRRNCYAYDLNNLKKKYMRHSDFQSKIEEIRRNRGLFTKFFEMIFYH